MSKTYISKGEVLSAPAPTGGVTAGLPYLVHGAGTFLVGIAQVTAAQTVSTDFYITGCHSVPKADSQAWTIGCKVYLDNTNHNFTTVTTSNTLAGVAIEAVASDAGLTTGKIRLDGAVR